jgi:predicted nucleic acid-binding protein
LKTSPKTYVLDANAILDYVQDGPGAATMERILREAIRHDAALMISVINLGEVFYWLWKHKGEQRARETVDDLALLGVQIVPVDLPQALQGGELKALHRIPYVDCIAAALTLEQKATLVTSDRDFEKLGRQFPILWLARP